MALNREGVIRAAEKYVSRGKLEAGIKEYRKVLAENPNDANTLNRVGDLYARIERFGEAVKLFTQIAEQYTRDGFFVKSIAIYKKIIKLDPSSLQVYERLAELYFKQGLINEARTQYQVLADYYQKHDNAASAISIFQKMSEIEPENPTFHLKLAELYESQRLTDKALGSYRQLADLLIVNGSIEEAAQVFLRALDIGSDDLDFIRSTVIGLHEGGHVGAAAKVLARAVESNPAAAAVAEEIGLAASQQQPGTEAELPDLGEAAAPADEFEPPPELDFAVPPALDETDATFVSPSAPTFADLEAEAATAAGDFASGASFAGADEQGDAELEVFTLDLEDDEIPDTLVAPPPDMLETAAPEDLGEAEPEVPEEEEPEAGDESSFEIDLSEVELELVDADAAAVEDLELAEAEAAAPAAEVEPAPAAGGFELSIDLDDPEGEEPSAIGLEPAEPTDLEPVELELAEIELDEVELEIEPL
ncbi:MAG: tetratricopeptide repeat protein, partial [Thermoanaerobaculia bacterium]